MYGVVQGMPILLCWHSLASMVPLWYEDYRLFFIIIILKKGEVMMKSPLVRLIGMAAWLITALCAVHVGMKSIGYDLMARFGLETNPMLNMYAEYAAGIAGVISLIMFVMALTCKGCGCCGNRSSCG